MCNPPVDGDNANNSNAYSAAQRIRDKLHTEFGDLCVSLLLPSDVALFVQKHFDALARDARLIAKAPHIWVPAHSPLPVEMPDYAVSG